MLGNSFGCQIAVELAVRHPDRVAGLVLVGPTMDSSARTAPW
jgi:pimeloyl-ACP methyl ester carboxylesterase